MRGAKHPDNSRDFGTPNSSDVLRNAELFDYTAITGTSQKISEPASGIPTFFVRPLGRTERLQKIAEVNIIGIAVYSRIDLYAQLTFLAKLRTKRSRPSFSAGAVRAP